MGRIRYDERGESYAGAVIPVFILAVGTFVGWVIYSGITSTVPASRMNTASATTTTTAQGSPFLLLVITTLFVVVLVFKFRE